MLFFSYSFFLYVWILSPFICYFYPLLSGSSSLHPPFLPRSCLSLLILLSRPLSLPRPLGAHHPPGPRDSHPPGGTCKAPPFFSRVPMDIPLSYRRPSLPLVPHLIRSRATSRIHLGFTSAPHPSDFAETS